MESIEIKDVPDFIDRVSFSDLVSGSTIFRGQSRKGKLLPGIARDDPKVNTTELEKEMLSELRKLGLTMVPEFVDFHNDWDMLVLAQHYGMKTRLLDWTYNALAALWFACSSRGDGDVYVYALESHSLTLESLKGSPFKQAKTKVITPSLSNDRIIAQAGCFTAHRYSESAGRFVPLEVNPDVKKHLTEYVVRGKYRIDILVTLERCGISSKTIYPDLGGICQFLNWRLTRSQ